MSVNTKIIGSFGKFSIITLNNTDKLHEIGLYTGNNTTGEVA